VVILTLPTASGQGGVKKRFDMNGEIFQNPAHGMESRTVLAFSKLLQE
jgi:hypothetical protein